MNSRSQAVSDLLSDAFASPVFSKDAAVAAEAVSNLSAQAEQGDLNALRVLALAYSEGAPHVRQDALKAYHFANQGAAQQDALCTTTLGYIQHRAGEMDKALASFKAAYDLGYDSAGINYAKMLLNGEGTRKSPLEGLSVLTRLADHDADAAITLADHLIRGEHIPQDLHKALAVLEEQESMFFILPPQQQALAYRGMATCLTQLGIEKSKKGLSAQALRQKAADLGDGEAQAQIQSEQNRAQHAAQRAEWDSICAFEAAGGKWQMFTKTGRLAHTENRSSKSVHSINGNVTTSSVHWKELTFVQSDGSQFMVKVESNAKPVNGRTYVALYIGMPGENAGFPFMLYDTEGGAPIRSTATLESTYPENTSRLRRFGFKMAYLITAGLLAAMFAGASIGFLGYLAIAGLGYGGFTLHKQYKGQFKQALAAAEAFVHKHKAALVSR